MRAISSFAPRGLGGRLPKGGIGSGTAPRIGAFSHEGEAHSVVLPGHGAESAIGKEIQTNPFVGVNAPPVSVWGNQ